MLQHILFWNYRDEISTQERERLQAWLESLPQQVPTLLSVQWGPIIGGRNQSFSHCFVMHFQDRAALDEYAGHPNHVAFAEAFRAACATQVVADFQPG